MEDPELLLLLRGDEDEMGGGDVESSHCRVPGVDVVQQLHILNLTICIFFLER